jgi:hypothetical protein
MLITFPPYILYYRLFCDLPKIMSIPFSGTSELHQSPTAINAPTNNVLDAWR